jgi:hypothetical protein
MAKKVLFILLACVLTTTLVVLRAIDFPDGTWLYYFSTWGIYFFILPISFLVLSTLSKKQTHYKLLIFITIGILSGLILTRGNYIENYVFLKIITTISGALVAIFMDLKMGNKS